MSVGRYFIFAGSILVALLLFADWYFPGSAVASRADVDRSILRITSDRRWRGAHRHRHQPAHHRPAGRCGRECSGRARLPTSFCKSHFAAAVVVIGRFAARLESASRLSASASQNSQDGWRQRASKPRAACLSFNVSEISCDGCTKARDTDRLSRLDRLCPFRRDCEDARPPSPAATQRHDMT